MEAMMKRKKKTEKKDTVKKKTKKNKKVSSTRMLINTKTITDYGLKLFNGEEVVFFVVQPQNLSVMSKENIGAKIFALTNVVKGLNDIEIICLNSRDNFEENKYFLKKRIQEETEEVVIKLLKEDLYHLEDYARQLFGMDCVVLMLILSQIAVRIKPDDQLEVHSLIHRIEKLIRMQNISVTRADKEMIKRMLAVYFEQNVTTSQFEDYDGKRWYDGIQ